MLGKRVFNSKIFSRWFFLYIAGIFLVLFVCLVIILACLSTIQRNAEDAQMISLNHAYKNVDNLLQAVEANVYRSTINTDILSLMQLSISYQTQTQSKTWEVQKQIKSLESSNILIDRCMIYVKKGNFLLQSSMKYSPKMYYDFSFPKKTMSFEALDMLLQHNDNSGYYTIKGSGATVGSSVLYTKDINTFSGNHYLGRIMVFLNDVQIRRQLINSKWVPACELFVLDDENHVISSTSTTIDIGELDAIFFTRNKGVQEVTLYGKPYMISFASSGINQWRYVSLIPKNVFYQSISTIKSISVIVLILCIFISIIVAYYIAKRNYSPINRIFRVLSQDENNETENLQEFIEIEKSIAHILSENKTRSDMIKNQRELLKRHFLARILSENFEQDIIPINIQLKNNGIEFAHLNFTVVLVRLDNYIRTSNTFDSNDYSVLVENIFQMAFNETPSGYDLWYTNTHENIVIILNYSDITNANQAIFNIVGNRVMVFANQYKIDLSVGISESLSGISRIKSGYEQAVITLEHIHFGDSTPVKLFSSIRKSIRINGMNSTIPFVKDMYYYAVSRNYNMAKKCLQDYFKSYYFEEEISTQIMNNRRHIIINTLLEIECLAAELIGDDIFTSIQAENRLFSCSGGNKLYEASLQILSEIEVLVEAKSSCLGICTVTEHAVEIIKESISNPNLNVSMVADILEVDIVYLSRNFKKKMGVNTLDYINRLRVDNAKRMLTDSSDSIEEISKKVGYSGSMSLIRIFKKYEGTTPGRYKASLLPVCDLINMIAGREMR